MAGSVRSHIGVLCSVAIGLILAACETSKTRPTPKECAAVADNLVAVVGGDTDKTAIYEVCKAAESPALWPLFHCIGDAKDLSDIDECKEAAGPEVSGELSPDGQPSPAQCEQFADHMVGLTTEEAVKILGEDSRVAASEAAQEERVEFLKTCMQDGTNEEVRCALKQNSIDELTANCT